MAFETKDGQRKYGNRMKANRYDKAHPAEEKTPKMKEGARAEAHEMGVNHEEPKSDMHQEIKSVVAEHGPAMRMQMMHDHAAMKSQVHTMHEDGHQHMAEHDGEEHVMHAHHHAMHAAGMNPPEETEKEMDEEKEGEYPEEHEDAPGEEYDEEEM